MNWRRLEHAGEAGNIGSRSTYEEVLHLKVGMLAFEVLLCDEDALAEEVLMDFLAFRSGNKHFVGVGVGRKVEDVTVFVLETESVHQNVVVRNNRGDARVRS